MKQEDRFIHERRLEGRDGMEGRQRKKKQERERVILSVLRREEKSRLTRVDLDIHTHIRTPAKISSFFGAPLPVLDIF